MAPTVAKSGTELTGMPGMVSLQPMMSAGMAPVKKKIVESSSSNSSSSRSSQIMKPGKVARIIDDEDEDGDMVSIGPVLSEAMTLAERLSILRQRKEVDSKRKAESSQGELGKVDAEIKPPVASTRTKVEKKESQQEGRKGRPEEGHREDGQGKDQSRQKGRG